MRARRATSILQNRRRTPVRNRLIRQLCEERATLQEEVKQLSAAIHIYKELARRAGAETFVTCL